MKKVLSLFLAVTILFSCTTADSPVSEKKELSPDIVQFKSANELHPNVEARKLGASAGFIFLIFRKSTNCISGWGICELAAFWINIYNAGRFDNEPNYCDIMPLEDGSFYGHIELADSIPAGYNTDFYIDEDITVGDLSEYTVKQGVYSLDMSMGTYGGYKLKIEKNK